MKVILIVAGAVVAFFGAGNLMRTPAPSVASVCEPCQDAPKQDTVPNAPAEQSSWPLPVVHDPVMVKDGGSYYVFATGRGVTVYTSPDLKTWSAPRPVLGEGFAWTREAVPGSTNHYWAPDIVKLNGKWHLYYSVSTFGKNRSVIACATNTTLDPHSPKYKWEDAGAVIETKPGDNWNAIDPHVWTNGKKAYLSAGSFWSGIKLIELEARTGKPKPNAPLIPIASRPHDNGIAGAVEAPFIVERDGYFYQFVSFDFCCRGVNSTYNIRVGRAKEITGPYLDKSGVPMTSGGGTLVVGASERWKGPGHNAVYREGKTDFLVYHAYDAEDKGIPKLQIATLEWREGWPLVSSREQ